MSNFKQFGNPIGKGVAYTLELLTPYERKLGVIPTVLNYQYRNKVMGLNEIEFDIPAYFIIDQKDVAHPFYHIIDNGMLIQVHISGQKEPLQYIVDTVNESTDKSTEAQKHIHAFSKEYFLSRKKFLGMELAGRILYYTPDLPEKYRVDGDGLPRGVLNDIFEKHGIEITHIDESLKRKAREVSIGSTNIYQFLAHLEETFGCIFKFNGDATKVEIYDSSSFGRNTGITISERNIINTFSEDTRYEDMVTRLYVYGSDEVSIASVNPTGLPYIDDFSYFLKENYLPKYLIDLYNEFAKLPKHNTELNSLVAQRNELLTRKNEAEFYLEVVRDELRQALHWAEALELREKNNTDYVGSDPKYEDSNAWNALKSSAEVKEFINAVKSNTTLTDKSFTSKNITFVSLLELSRSADGELQKLFKDDLETLQARGGEAGWLAEIERLEQEYISVTESVKNLQKNNDFNQYMSEQLSAEQFAKARKAIDAVTIEGEYINSDLDSTMLNELLEEGKKELDKMCFPKIQFTVDALDFSQLLDTQDLWNYLSLGDIIYVKTDTGFNYPVHFIGIEHSPDTASLNLQFSSSAALTDSTIFLADLIANATRANGILSMNKDNWNKAAAEASAINQQLKEGFDLAQQRLAGASKQMPILDERGFWLYALDSNENPKPEQIRAINNVIALTKDGWETIEVAITPEGINANTIVVGTMSADRIRLGRFESADKTTYWDLETNEIKIGDTFFFSPETGLEIDFQPPVKHKNLISTAEFFTEYSVSMPENVRHRFETNATTGELRLIVPREAGTYDFYLAVDSAALTQNFTLLSDNLDMINDIMPEVTVTLANSNYEPYSNPVAITKGKGIYTITPTISSADLPLSFLQIRLTKDSTASEAGIIIPPETLALVKENVPDLTWENTVISGVSSSTVINNERIGMVIENNIENKLAALDITEDGITQRVSSSTKEYFDLNKDQLKGADGNTPYVEDGYWFINGTNTGVKAEGQDGAKGADGAPGKGIKDTKYRYAKTSAPSPEPTESQWSATKPEYAKGDYAWTQVTWEYSDGTSENSAPMMSYIAEDGVGISNTLVAYALSTTNVQPSDSLFSPEVPDSKPGDYVWTRVTLDYTADGVDNTKFYTVARVGKDGKDGNTGKDGIAGKDGKGITSTTITYGLSTTDTVEPTNYTSNVPTLVKGQYLWTKTVWEYTDNTTETGYTKTYIAKDGNDGTNGVAGKDGVGIKTTTIEYAQSSSGTVTPTSGWATTVPSVTQGNYLWTKTTWNYTDNTSETGYSVAHVGKDGAKGIPGTPGADGGNFTWNLIQHTKPINLTQYKNWQHCTLERISDTEGEYIKVGYTTGDAYMGVQTPVFSITQGATYTFSAWIKPSVDSDTFDYLYVMSPSKGNVGVPRINGSYPASNWTKVTVKFIAPYTTDDARFMFAKTAKSIPETYFFNIKEIMISEGDNPNQVWSPHPNDLKGTDGLPGKDGVGLDTKKTKIEYVGSTSGTTAPSSGWTTAVPVVASGNYLWTKTTWTYTDLTTEVGYSVSRIGKDGNTGKDGVAGKDGVGINTSKTIIQYAVSSSGTTAPSSGWVASPPSASPGQYMWTRTILTYTDNTTETVYSVGKIGNTGPQGPQGVQGANGKDGIPGVDGKPGIGISKTVIDYAGSTSGTTAPTTGYTTTVPTVAPGNFLWTRTTWTYTDATTETSYSVGLIGKNGNTGKDGNPGKDGVGIDKTLIEYAKNTSGTVKPTTGWSTTIPSTAPGDFLWTRTTWTYTDTTSEQGYTVGKIGNTGPQGPQGDQGPRGATGSQGPRGATGTSVESVTEYYLATSASSGIQSSNTGFTTAMQPLTATNKYLWNYEKINFSDGTSQPTIPVIIGVYGDKGQTGNTGPTGRSIVSITEHYLATTASSGVTRSTSGWSTAMQPTTETKRYLWNYETINWSSGTTPTYVEPIIIGVHGAKGSQGANGKDGATPYIGANGNWWINGIDTGVEADVAPIREEFESYRNQTDKAIEDRVTKTEYSGLTTRVAQAEQKLTPTSITQTVENNTTTLATKAEVQTTAENWTAKFSQIGGRNLVKRSGELENQVVGLTGEIQASTGNAAMDEYIPVTPGEVLSFSRRSSTNADGGWFRFAWYAANKGFISRVAYSSLTFQWTVPQDTYFIRVSYPMDAYPKIERGDVATEWTPHPEELYTGITTIDKDGVTVGREGETIETNLGFDGVRIADGATEIASFTGSGAVINHLEAESINGDVINIMSSSMTFDIGSGTGYYADFSEVLNAIGNRKHLANGVKLTINIRSVLNETIRIEGFSGSGSIEVNIYSRVNGHIRTSSNSCVIRVYGKNTTHVVSASSYTVISSADAYVLFDGLNIDSKDTTGGVGILSQDGSNVHVLRCDMINCQDALRTGNAGKLQANNTKGNPSRYAAMGYGGSIWLSGTIPDGGTAWFVYTNGNVTRTPSSFSPPATTTVTETRTFNQTDIYTYSVQYGAKSNHYGKAAAQNRWDTSMTQMKGRIVFGSSVYSFISGRTSGTTPTVKMRLRRQNSSHGTSASVNPTPEWSGAPSFGGATRGNWTPWVTIPYTLFTSSGYTFSFYNGTTGNSYAIWDRAEIQITRRVTQ